MERPLTLLFYFLLFIAAFVLLLQLIDHI